MIDSPAIILDWAARLEALRPQWEAEPSAAGLSLFPGPAGEEEEAVLEAARRQAARGREEAELELIRLADPPAWPPPASLGPWPLRPATADQPADQPVDQPMADQPMAEQPIIEQPNVAPPTAERPLADRRPIVLPPDFRLSPRRWAGEALLASLAADWLAPSPGVPERRHKPALALAAGPSAAPLAALWAGSGPATFLAEDPLAAEKAQSLAARNAGAFQVETGSLARRRPGAFGLILIRHSPYLIARRLKILARLLAPDGALLAAGFAPGFQTALILRAAGRAGLLLAASVVQDGWAALRLRPAPPEPRRPPLGGSVVPALADWPGDMEEASEEISEEILSLEEALQLEEEAEEPEFPPV